MGDYSLDVPDPQIFLHFPGDANGVFYHQRLLLCRLGPGRWVASSPDHELEILDLNNRRHVVLGRRSPFPGHLNPDELYVFDPIGRNELEALRRQAKTMSMVLGEETVEEIQARTWVFADPGSSRLGQSVPRDVLDHAVTLGGKGVAEIEGDSEWIEEILETEVKTFSDKRKGSLGDSRILGKHTDGQGKRFITLADAMSIMNQVELNDWQFKGPRSVGEYLTSIRESGVDLPSYHLQWVKSSGVNPKTSLVHEHRNLVEVLRLAICKDQLNPLNCMSFELVTRRLIQLEIAVSRSAQSPEFSGLEIMMENPIEETGSAATKSMDVWLTDQLKARAQIQKQSRLFREELSYQRRDRGQPAGEEDNPNPGWRRKKPKAKAKSGAGSGGAGAGDS